MTDRNEVYSAIDDERVFQDRKWGTIEQHPHEVGSWLTIMRQLLNDAEREYMSQRGDHGALDEIRKVAAVGVACMEQHGPVPRSPLDFAAQSKNLSTFKKDSADDELSESLRVANSRLSKYQKAINQIDDYFEYAMDSKTDQKKVHQILGNLTDALDT